MLLCPYSLLLLTASLSASAIWHHYRHMPAPLGRCKEIDGNPNLSPVAKNDWNYGTPWKIGEYIHATNSTGYAGPTNFNFANGMRPGSGVSVGCLLLLPKDFNMLNKAMNNLSTFKVRVAR